MKFIVPLILMAVGFGTCSQSAREVFMSQPNWLMGIEVLIAYTLVGFLNGIEVTARAKARDPRDYDAGMHGLFAGILWPAWWTVVVPSVFLVCHVGSFVANATAKRIDNREVEILRKMKS